MLRRDKDIERDIRTLIFWAFFLVFAAGFSSRSDGHSTSNSNDLPGNYYTVISLNHREAVTVNPTDISSLWKFFVNELGRDDLLLIYHNLKITADNSKAKLAIDSLENARLNISKVSLVDLLCCLRFCNSGDIPVLS